MRPKLTAIGLLAFAAFIAAPARSISPAIPQDDIEVQVHGSGADFVFNSLQKYGASQGLQCAYRPGGTSPDVVCGNGRFVIRAVYFSPDNTVSIRAYRKYGDSGAQASIVFVISNVMADARANSERQIKQYALGRKLWMFCYDKVGARASANLFSLVMTARANDLEPFEYLCRLFEQLPAATTVEAIEALLPWNFKSVLDARCNRQKPAS